ncbi:MAG TPA: LysR family transcriptional regulator [Cytophagales bacterium]|nr:LysR family transcriptional regulator [Cytophagales bacterium]
MIFDFRLKVFYTVAHKLSFTKASHELFITQPAVTKHINELEQQLKVPLFKRHGNTISLTPAGQVLEKYAQQIFQIYASLENELVQMTDEAKGNIRIGASTTLAQYVLPKILALFKKAHPSIHVTFINGNSEFIEQQVINEKIDIAIVEGISHLPQIMYEPFVKDEIVLVCKLTNKLSQKGEIKPDQLLSIPLILREHGSGTLDVIYKALSKASIHPKDLRNEIQLDSTESIKQYLMFSECAAFLSIHSIARELRQNELSIIDIKGIDIYRTFQFIRLHGQTTKLPELFKRFCLSHYNFK